MECNNVYEILYGNVARVETYRGGGTKIQTMGKEPCEDCQTSGRENQSAAFQLSQREKPISNEVGFHLYTHDNLY